MLTLRPWSIGWELPSKPFCIRFFQESLLLKNVQKLTEKRVELVLEARKLVRHLKLDEREEGCLDPANAIVEWEHWCKNVTTVESSTEVDMFPPDTIKGWSEVPESAYPVTRATNQTTTSAASLATLALDCPVPSYNPPGKHILTSILSAPIQI